MTNDKPVNPRLNEDLRFEKKAGGPPRYNSSTDGPVQYLTVADAAGEVIGYAWANDADDAAGWLIRKAGGPAAFNEGFLWATWLHKAKARDIAPSAALAEMIRDSTAGGDSRVVPGSLTEAPNVEVVRSLASAS
ncbi:hypothetical protein OG808_20785 [Streptomyces sp. NBC_01761]|uniref:hypothetical protein n=1 Tax=unclassified Streptomyces TaxID=2593676 RepID=UPI002DD7B442|nr:MULTISPECIES: hypothetical protein [unclassified Streptomyces]WSC54505.1 hypothetical protein OG808_20785 [Streptomyces sp. NBC_01761]